MAPTKFIFFCFLFFIRAIFELAWGQPVSFNKDVLPIILNKCANCHHQNGYAPFALTNYEEVKRHTKEMAIVIPNHSMPPWKADANYRDFAANRSLSLAEKELIISWIKAGAYQDNPDKLKLTYAAYKPDTPDILLQMSKPYLLKASNKNTYISYKIPYELDSNYAISGIQFIPGSKIAVHHASYQVFELAADVEVFAGPDYFTYIEDSLNRVDDTRDFNYFNMIGKSGELPKELYHGGWLPGTDKITFPRGVGFNLPKRGVIIIRSLHYSPSPIDVSDQSAIGFYASKVPINRSIGFAAFQPRNPSPGYSWTIAADSIYRAHLNVRFSNDVSLLFVNPHMHLIGKTFKAMVVTPQADTIPLVYIPEWDFNWQDFYRFKKMVKIPAGSVLHAEATYDNTNQNPFNPHYPAKSMPFETGMNESNEMMRLVILYLPYLIGDENISLE